jgi:hypothetical protein
MELIKTCIDLRQMPRSQADWTFGSAARAEPAFFRADGIRPVVENL